MLHLSDSITQHLNVLAQLLHLLLADYSHLLLHLEVLSAHFQLEIDLAKACIELVRTSLICLFTLFKLSDFLLEVQYNHRRPNHIVINHNPVLLALQLLPQVGNSFVLLADQVVFALMAQLAPPERVDKGLVHVLLAMLEDDTHLKQLEEWVDKKELFKLIS